MGTLLTIVCIAVAFILGYFIASSKKSKASTEEETTATKQTVIEQKEEDVEVPSGSDVYYERATFAEVLKMTWDMYDKNPETKDLMEIHVAAGDAQIILDKVDR